MVATVRTNSQIKRWAVACAIFIVAVVLMADTRRLGFLGVIYDCPFGDKVGHFVLFGGLSLLVNLSVYEAMPQPNIRSALVANLTIAVLIGLEEVSQLWIRSRTFSLVDLAASYVGVAGFAWLAARIRPRR